MADRSASGRWHVSDVPDQRGRTAVVTGASSGIGLETAKVLAARGATAVLACRDVEKGKAAAGAVRAAAPGAAVDVVRLDLSSLSSVRAAAEEVRSRYDHIDLLVNNAGVLSHSYARTTDGFELQFGTNHLGHFALTGLLLDRLLAVPGSRVVTVSSNGHRLGEIRFADLHFERRYRRFAAYGQSKLANLLFTYELQRRLDAAGAGLAALAVHPGGARTGVNRGAPAWYRALVWPVFRWVGQSAEMGAAPTLRAATDLEARGGEYYGPSGPFGAKGPPAPTRSSDRSYDLATARRLWDVSEELTGVEYLV